MLSRMTTSLRRLAPLLVLVYISLAGCDEHASDREAIVASFYKLTEAAAAGDGAEFVKWISPDTFAYYDKMIKIALDAKKEEVERLAPFEKWDVFEIRGKASRAAISKLGGKKLLELACEDGWYSMVEPHVVKLTKWKFYEDEAYAQPSGFFYRVRPGTWLRFVRHEGRWTFDQLSLKQNFDMAVEEDAQRDRISPDYAIMRELGLENVARHLYEPMR